MVGIAQAQTRTPLLRASLTLAVVASAIALALVALPAQPAQALTNGQPVTNGFPRVSSWWPDASTSNAKLANLDYLVPYEWLPMQPDVTRLANLRSVNLSTTAGIAMFEVVRQRALAAR